MITDSLTGLLNRAGFEQAVRDILDTQMGSFVLVYCDIDRFKVFNDRFGVEAGDKLLVAMGAKFASWMPEGGVAARLRADHFACFVPAESFDADETLAELDAWLGSYESSFAFFVRMGIYRIVDPGLDVNLMCDRALLALRVAKESKGASNYRVYDERFREELLAEQALAAEMAAALDEGQLVPYFQPQLNYDTGAVVGAEVLARWIHPERGLIGPGEFIGIMERSGLIGKLDRLIWEEAARYLGEWISTYGIERVVHLSVNVSRADLLNPDLASTLTDIVKRHNVRPEMMHLEITEALYVEDPDRMTAAINALHEAGFMVEMDDFGKGYSSLSMLKDANVDIIKLDMGFLNATGDARGGIVLASVVRMARWLNLPVIAEGVETSSQASYLASVGCDFMQGYLFARPMPVDEYVQMMGRSNRGEIERPRIAVLKPEAHEFWDQDSGLSYFFDTYVGAAAIMTFDGERVEIIRANGGFRRAMQLPAKDYCQFCLNVLGFADAESRQECLAAFEQAVNTDDEATCSFRMLGRVTLTVRLNIRSLSSVNNLHSLYVLAETQTDAQTLRNRIDAITESIPGGTALYEVSDHIELVEFSDLTSDLANMTREEYLEASRKDTFSLVYEEDRPAVIDLIDQIRSGTPRGSCTIRVVASDGSLRWVHMSAAAMHREADRLYAVAVYLDATKDKELEERRAAEAHSLEAQRLANVLCSQYDEVFEIRPEADSCRLLASEFHACDEFGERPYADALARWSRLIQRESDREKLDRLIRECAKGDSAEPVRFRYRVNMDGKLHWCETTLLHMGDDVMLCCNKDVTEAAEEEGRYRTEYAAKIVGNLPVGVGVYIMGENGIFPLFVSDTACDILGLTREEYDERIAKRQPIYALDGALAAMERESIDFTYSGDIDTEFRTERRDGSPLVLHVQGRMVPRGEATTVIYATISDVTDEDERRRERTWQTERYRLLSELTQAISFDYDSESDTVLLYIDRTGEGMEAQMIPNYLETLGTLRKGVVHPDSVDDVRRLFECARAGDTNVQIDYRADYYGNGYRWYRATLYVVHDEDGVWHLVGLIANIEDMRALQKRAEHDQVTGLSNRAMTSDLITRHLAGPPARRSSVCAVVDIDDFKVVNDTCGHLEGDRLLRAVGSILHESFREDDVIGRVGGDEFVLFLRDLDPAVALKKLGAVKDEISQIELQSSGTHPSVSMGVYVVQVGDKTYRSVFSCADKALYEAKRQGKDRIVVCNEDGGFRVYPDE